jgi:hypothetical protein
MLTFTFRYRFGSAEIAAISFATQPSWRSCSHTTVYRGAAGRGPFAFLQRCRDLIHRFIIEFIRSYSSRSLSSAPAVPWPLLSRAVIASTLVGH